MERELHQPSCHLFAALTVDHAVTKQENWCAKRNVSGGFSQKDAIAVCWEAVVDIAGLEIGPSSVLLHFDYIAAGQPAAVVDADVVIHFVGWQGEVKLAPVEKSTAASRRFVAVATVVGAKVGCGSSAAEDVGSPADCNPSQRARKYFLSARKKDIQ